MTSTPYSPENPKPGSSPATYEFGQPRWFGSEKRPLFGWLHLPPAFERRVAVVLCPPFGHEYMVVYRSYRKLAAHLAAAGFAVIRFDYDGTGDSAGHGTDSQRVSRWQESIISAVEEIRETTGCEKTVLFGTRLGALLAATVANNTKTDHLILLAPVASGRLYIRELLAFRAMNSITIGENIPVSPDEVAGYPLTREIREDLATLDYTVLSGENIKSIMIIPRDDIPSNEKKIADALKLQGNEVEVKKIAGYGNLMKDDALESQVPAEIWTSITDWLTERYPSTYVNIQPNLATKSATIFRQNGFDIYEEILQVNGNRGILTTTKNKPQASAKPTIIITNTGANHRVGNHRLCVTMARSFAQRGFRVLRFDRPGMGDSAAQLGFSENEIYSSSGLQGLISMMDYLGDRLDHNEFILAGLCSGGYFSYQAALLDKRVVGLLMINPLTYQWRDGDTVLLPSRQIYKSTRFYLRNSLRKENWLRLIKGNINWRGIATAISIRISHRITAKFRMVISRPILRWNSVSDIAQTFIELESRGTDILMIFDSAEGGIDIMEEHLGKNASLMANKKNFRIKFIDNADHTFTPIWAQSYLCDLIGEHWERRFGGP